MEKQYVVLMSSGYVRDAQIFNGDSKYNDTKISDEEFEDVDMFDEESEKFWQDAETTIFAGIYVASSEEEACKMAADKNNYDARTLYAEEIMRLTQSSEERKEVLLCD